MLKTKSISCFDDKYFNYDGIYKIEEYQGEHYNNIGLYLLKKYDYRELIFVTARGEELKVTFNNYYTKRLLIKRVN